MTQNNNFMSLYGFAFVILVIRRISFDISGHPKKKKKKHCELSCYNFAITKANL